MSLRSPVYLDFCATTPVAPEVLEAMMPHFSENFGNPSSVHRFGQRADAVLEQAREDIAACLNCLPDEIFFTSGGTESDNLAIRGSALAVRERTGKNHIITTGVEHPAVVNTVADLAKYYGFARSIVRVDQHGFVEQDDLVRILTDQTSIVSVIFANNEIGTINPISHLAELCHQRGALFHTDAVQAGGLLSLNLRELRVDLLSLGAHKFYGPKGVGVLFIRKGTPIHAIQTGGSHERGLRAGTSNIPYIAGMAAALKLAVSRRDEDTKNLISMREQIVAFVSQKIPLAQLTGDRISRLPNHASFVFPGVDGNELVTLLDHAGFACSSGSACKTGDPQPSDVLLALGIKPQVALGSLRISLGRGSWLAEVQDFLDILPGMVEKATTEKTV
jgi:cysteine desulfurase